MDEADGEWGICCDNELYYWWPVADKYRPLKGWWFVEDSRKVRTAGDCPVHAVIHMEPVLYHKQRETNIVLRRNCCLSEHAPLVEFMYPVFTRMPSESYRRWVKVFLFIFSCCVCVTSLACCLFVLQAGLFATASLAISVTDAKTKLTSVYRRRVKMAERVKMASTLSPACAYQVRHPLPPPPPPPPLHLTPFSLDLSINTVWSLTDKHWRDFTVQSVGHK